MGDTNGLWKTRAYRSWSTIKASGLEIDPRWDDPVAFISDMGERPPGKNLVRIDRTRGYSPDNCRWGSWADKQNRSKSNVVIEFNGRSQTLMEWSTELSINWRTLWNRLFRSPTWTVQDAFTTPARKRGGR